MQLIFFEPHCRNVEHAQYNAAFVSTGMHAFPDDEIVFLGEGDHCMWVKKSLELMDPSAAQKVKWRETDIAPQSVNYISGTIKRLQVYNQPFRYADGRTTRGIIYCSCAIKGLMVLKTRLAFLPLPYPLLAIFHNQLPRIIPYDRGLLRVNQVRLLLRLPVPRKLRFIALGVSIYNYLVQLNPAYKTQFASMDLPRMREVKPERPPMKQGKVFGFFGVTLNKGFDQFANVARSTKTKHPDADFVLVGYLNHSIDGSKYNGLVSQISLTPMPPAEYSALARTVKYAVIVANPDDYRLRASAAFLDAMAFGIPGIYIRNPYIEHYFQRFGDIGYLCDSMSEIEKTIDGICRSFPEERYLRQSKNCSVGAAQLEPAMVAQTFRTIIELLASE